MAVVLVVGFGACQHGTAAPRGEEDLSDRKVVEMRALLESAPPGGLCPELDAVSPGVLAETPRGKKLVEWAREAAGVAEIPETTYTLYRVFKATGERSSYQRPYGEKRRLLDQEALAVWLGGDMSRVDRVNDLIWSICEETTWVYPAHERPDRDIDLGAAETGASLAHIVAYLGERLPEEIRERVRQELTRRIFDPFLDHGEKYWWSVGRNNWTGVCAGSIGEAFLLVEKDLDRQAKGLALVLDQLDRFIDLGFESDGGCLEGIGYWQYGLSHLVVFGEMMRARTTGKIDLLGGEKMKAIARYPLAVYMGHGTYASFADSHDKAFIAPYLAGKLSERTGAVELNALTNREDVDGRFAYALRGLVWRKDEEPRTAPLSDIYMPASAIVRMVGKADKRDLVMVAKAGHNAEPHNHNDVGSFVLAVDGEVYLCDPGAGLYNKDYFSAKRYENVFANSYGHSVPRIGGQLQSAGAEFRGTMEKTGGKSVLIRFEKAYAVPELTEATRAISLRKNGLMVEDRFGFSGNGLEVEEAFMTWRQVEVEGKVARIVGEAGALEIETDQGAFAAERLEEACKGNRKDGVLTRLTVTHPPSPTLAARFMMTFVPKS